MRRVLMIAGAALICAGPALAEDVTVEKHTTVTKELVPAEPNSGSTTSTVIIAPEAPPAPRVEVRPEPPRPGMAWMEGHWGGAPRPGPIAGSPASSPSRRGRAPSGAPGIGSSARTAGSLCRATGAEPS